MTTTPAAEMMTDAQYRARLAASRSRVREHVLRHLAEGRHGLPGAELRRKLRSTDRHHLVPVLDSLRADGLVVVLKARGGGADGVKYLLVGRGGHRRLRNQDVPCDVQYCQQRRRPTGRWCGRHITEESRAALAPGRLPVQ